MSKTSFSGAPDEHVGALHRVRQCRETPVLTVEDVLFTVFGNGWKKGFSSEFTRMFGQFIRQVWGKYQPSTHAPPSWAKKGPGHPATTPLGFVTRRKSPAHEDP